MNVLKKYWFLPGVILISLASFWRILTFTFWKDDWWYLWTCLHTIAGLRDWLQPGTPIEFALVTPIFKANPLPWQILGLLLHVGVAVLLARFIHVFTNSRRTGVITGIVYAASYAGMDAVGWPSAHVSIVSTIFLLVGLTYFVRYVKGSSLLHASISLIYLLIALILDPFRMFPLFIPLPLIAMVSGAKKSFVSRLIKTEIILIIAGSIPLITILGHHITGSQLVTHLTSPSRVFSHIYVVGNYFNTIANLFFGWFIPFPEYGSTGVYNPIWARIGLLLFCISVGVAYAYAKNRREKTGIVLVFLFWIFLFYISDWLFEPRLTMGGTHRYLVVSAVGFISLVGFVLSNIKNKIVCIAAISVFIGANIIMANYYSAQAAPYRSVRIIDAIWQTINTEIPAHAKNVVFVYSGEDPVKTFALDLSGPYPFALVRNISIQSDFPKVTADAIGVSPSDVYYWHVAKNGVISKLGENK